MTGTAAQIALAPPVLLAPMAGITDLPLRRIVAGFGAGLVVSEMVASEEVVRARPEARARAELGFGDAATAVQLVGCEARWLAEAARLVEANGRKDHRHQHGLPQPSRHQRLVCSMLPR